MQSYNENNEMVQALILEARKNSVSDAFTTAEDKGAIRHVIARIPTQGAVVEVNGIRYRVTQVNAKKGKLHLELLKP